MSLGTLPARRPRLRLRHALHIFEGLAFRAIRRWLARLLSILVRLSLFLGTALVTGLGSAYFVMDKGTSLTVVQSGPWALWPAAGRPDADPYTRAHFARLGALPIGAASAHYFMATTDANGAPLYGDCEYELAGSGPEAAWWSLALYGHDGRLKENDFDRYAITGATALRDTSGRITVRIASDVRSGNWLPSGDDGGFRLLLRVYQPAADKDGLSSPGFGTIERIGCR
ncbi:MAG: DUF1214 domain-containing protein [Hyphomicrobiaceae bacterium]